jgi:hypothetical protein
MFLQTHALRKTYLHEKSAEITYGFYNKATAISDYESMFYSKYNTKK